MAYIYQPNSAAQNYRGSFMGHSHSNHGETQCKMINPTDLYLGAFLILCGFALSLLNLRRLVKEVNSSFPAVLISENVLLMCIGIAFISRAAQDTSPMDTEMQDIQLRITEMAVKSSEMNCNYFTVLRSYGPSIVALVNSFISLVIDNYMHYRMLADVKKEDEENTVQEFDQGFRNSDVSNLSKVFAFGKKYFSYMAIVLQWIVPILIALSMYPMEVKERQVSRTEGKSSSSFCMAVVEASNKTCFPDTGANFSLELRKFVPPSYLEAHDILQNNDSTTKEIDLVVNNVYKILSSMNNQTLANINVTSAPLWRKGKINDDCLNVCYLDNKSLTIYMFVIATVSYFIPIIISTIILSKIHVMDIKRPGIKTYVSRELLYNILFWTPVMFDTFLSLLLCSYNMNGMRTSIFNVIANVYQAVKNFMNTKYFQDNSVKPI